MKNTFKAVLSAVLFLIPAFSLFSQTEETTGPRVPQTVADEYVNKGGLVYSKKTQGPNKLGEYTIFLKTFVTGEVSTEQRHIPSDIILVLDVSGSMSWRIGRDSDPAPGQNSRLDELKIAVKNFITQIEDDAEKNHVDSKIAIVKFAWPVYSPNETSLDEKDEATYYDRYYGHTTSVLKKFYSVSDNAQMLRDAVDDIDEQKYGATASDYGMRKAELLLNNLLNADDDETKNRVSNKIIVFFTDGEPQYSGSNTKAISERTITTAKTIKSTTAYTDPVTGKSATCKVYSIGLFTNPTTTVRTFMQRVSSNYPNATGMDYGEQGTDGSSSGGYYFEVSDADELKNAFETIGQDSASSSIDLGQSATAVDVVSQSFDIPYIKGEDGNLNTDVKVWTTPLVNITKGADNKDIYSFATTGWDPAGEEVELEVNPLTGEVSVTGFDYSANACAIVNKRPVGSQLIIEIPIKMDDNAVGGHGVATNGPGSGIKYKEKQPDGSFVDKLIKFDTPAINLPTNLEIKKEGLQEGESARFRIQRRAVDSTGAWEDYSTVFITNKKTNEGFSKDGTVKIIGLNPDYVYRIIEEEGWSWSYGGTTVTGLRYDPVTGDRTTVTDMTNGTAANNWNDNTVTSDKVNLNPITFTNKKKAVQVRHAESIVINDFKGASADAQAGHTENSKEQP